MSSRIFVFPNQIFICNAAASSATQTDTAAAGKNIFRPQNLKVVVNNLSIDESVMPPEFGIMFKMQPFKTIIIPKTRMKEGKNFEC